MRLSEAEVASIKEIVKRVDPDGVVFLFGSRADDTRRGGDIDLYLESSMSLDLKTVYLMQHRISAACDTDVDLLVKQPSEEDEPIFEIARKGIRL